MSDKNNKPSSNRQNVMNYKNNIEPFLEWTDFLDADLIYAKIYAASKSTDRGYQKSTNKKNPNKRGRPKPPLSDRSIVNSLNPLAKLMETYAIFRDSEIFRPQYLKLKAKVDLLNAKDTEEKKLADSAMRILPIDEIAAAVKKAYVKKTDREIYKTRIFVELNYEFPARDNFQIIVTENLADFAKKENNWIYVGKMPYEVILNKYKTDSRTHLRSNLVVRVHDPIQLALSMSLSREIKDYMTRYEVKLGDYLLGKSKLGLMMHGVFQHLGIDRGRFGSLQYLRRSTSKSRPDAETARLMGHSLQTHLQTYQTTDLLPASEARAMLANVPIATHGAGSRSASRAASRNTTPVTTPGGTMVTRSRGKTVTFQIPAPQEDDFVTEFDVEDEFPVEPGPLLLPTLLTYTFRPVQESGLFSLSTANGPSSFSSA